MDSTSATVEDAAFERAWRRFRIRAAAVTAVVLAGAAALVLLNFNRSANVPDALRPVPLPSDHLTGLGATDATFAATHTQPLPKQRYGPLIHDAATGDDIPTYDLANSTGIGYVDTLIHAFPVHSARSTVLADVRAHDLPVDARLVRTTSPDRSCQILSYQSATVASAGPYEDFGDGTLTVTLYSRTGAPFSPSDVQWVYEQLNPTSDDTEC